VTTPAEVGTGYTLPPVSLLGPNATHLFVASRTVSLLTGTATNCDLIQGHIEIGTVGGASGFNSHIIGCIIEGGAVCDSTQADFVDANGPVFTPASPTTMEMRRMADDATCAHVRGLFLGQ
jgi:hypothetical protein